MVRSSEPTKADQLRMYFKRLLNPPHISVQDLLRAVRGTPQQERTPPAIPEKWLPSTDPKVAIYEEKTHALPPLPENIPAWVHEAIYGTARDGATTVTPAITAPTPQQTDPIRLRDKKPAPETREVVVPWVASPRGPERGRPYKAVQLRPMLVPRGTYGDKTIDSVSDLVVWALAQFHEQHPKWEVASIAMNTINCACLHMSARRDMPYYGIPLTEDATLKDYQVQVVGAAPRARATG